MAANSARRKHIATPKYNPTQILTSDSIGSPDKQNGLFILLNNASKESQLQQRAGPSAIPALAAGGRTTTSAADFLTDLSLSEAIIYRNSKAIGKLVRPAIDVSPVATCTEQTSEDLQLVTFTFKRWQPVADNKASKEEAVVAIPVDTDFKSSDFRFQLFARHQGSPLVLQSFSLSGREAAAAVSQHLQRLAYIQQQHSKFTKQVLQEDLLSSQPARDNKAEYTFEQGSVLKQCAILIDTTLDTPQVRWVSLKLALVQPAKVDDAVTPMPAIISGQASNHRLMAAEQLGGSNSTHQCGPESPSTATAEPGTSPANGRIRNGEVPYSGAGLSSHGSLSMTASNTPTSNTHHTGSSPHTKKTLYGTTADKSSSHDKSVVAKPRAGQHRASGETAGADQQQTQRHGLRNDGTPQALGSDVPLNASTHANGHSERDADSELGQQNHLHGDTHAAGTRVLPGTRATSNGPQQSSSPPSVDNDRHGREGAAAPNSKAATVEHATVNGKHPEVAHKNGKVKNGSTHAPLEVLASMANDLLNGLDKGVLEQWAHSPLFDQLIAGQVQTMAAAVAAGGSSALPSGSLAPPAASSSSSQPAQAAGAHDQHGGADAGAVPANMPELPERQVVAAAMAAAAASVAVASNSAESDWDSESNSQSEAPRSYSDTSSSHSDTQSNYQNRYYRNASSSSSGQGWSANSRGGYRNNHRGGYSNAVGSGQHSKGYGTRSGQYNNRSYGNTGRGDTDASFRPPSRGPTPGPREAGYDGPPTPTSNDPAATTDLERFLVQVTPMLALEPAKPLEQALHELCLEDVWKFYSEPSLYGREVYTLGGSRGPSLCYFVPYLSAIQLFTPATSKDPGTNRLYISDTEGWAKHMHLKFQYFENELPFNRCPLYEQIEILAGQCPMPTTAAAESTPAVTAAADVASSTAQEPAGTATGSGMQTGSAESTSTTGMEASSASSTDAADVASTQPSTKTNPSVASSSTPAAATATTPPVVQSVLRNTKICELHPASWFAVAWYPVYRIPDAPLCARFLTFHSFAPLVISMQHAQSALEKGQHRPVSIMPLQVVGLKWYNMHGERWLEALAESSSARHQDDANSTSSRGSSHRRHNGQSMHMDPAWQAHLSELQMTAERLARGHGLRLLGQMGAEDVRLRHPDFEFFSTRP